MMSLNLRDYLSDKFNNKMSSSVYIRFELGASYPNGSQERINQVYSRVKTIFANAFSGCKHIHLIIKDWESNDPMFGNTTPDYLYTLFDSSKMETAIIVEEDKDIDDTIIYNKHKEHTLVTDIEAIDYNKILEGIANYEQGREPSIGQQVFFIDTNKDIIFHMYDDRGCDVYACKADNIRVLYQRFGEWILDYNRQEIDKIFK